MTMRSSQGRNALTLLEVIVAMAIFLISVIAIFQLLFLGTERALDVRLQTRTSLRCQAKLAEIMVGAEPLNSTGSYTNFTDTDTDLQWRMEATPSDDKQLLWTVKVWVKIELQTGKVVESQLCQLMLNPSMRGTTFDQPAMTPAGTPTTDSSTTPSATTPSATMPATGGAAAPKTGGAAAPKTGGAPAAMPAPAPAAKTAAPATTTKTATPAKGP